VFKTATMKPSSTRCHPTGTTRLNGAARPRDISNARTPPGCGSSHPDRSTGIAGQYEIGAQRQGPLLPRSVLLSLRRLRTALGEPPWRSIRLDAGDPRLLA